MPEPRTPLPTDPFDQALARLTGLPNGAHTQPTVIQDVDFYGNTTRLYDPDREARPGRDLVPHLRNR